MPHKLSLIVPGLCGPVPRLEDMETSVAPLVALLKRCRKQTTPATDYPSLLADLFGVQSDNSFPSAALALLGHGNDPDDACWIHADPVSLQADMDRAILSDSQTLHIRPDEAEQLVNELNAHFAVDGLSVVMVDKNNWFIRLSDCDLQTTPLSHAVGRNINQLLPSGSAAAQWKPLLNEIQMLMHMSEVNQRREQRGQAAINSLWLWGEGTMPAQVTTDITHVYTDEAVTAGLARLAAIKHSPLTNPITLAYAMQQHGHSLVSINQLDGPCNYGDTSTWLDELAAVVADWLAPLIEAASSLDVNVDIYPCNGVRYHFSNKNKSVISKLIFWKKDRLQDYVETH